MEIYLIRHTQPKVASGICYGQSDIGLANSFPEELASLKEELKHLLDDHNMVYSSPLSRCQKLAHSLFKEVILIDPRLMELDFGTWELQAWDDIPKEQLQPWMENFVHVPCPNGESYMDMYRRCIDFIHELQSNGIHRVILFTHAGPIRAIHAYANGIDLKDSFDLKVKYGEVVKVRI